MKRMRIEPSRALDAHCLGVEVTVAAYVVHISSRRHVARHIDGVREGDGGHSAPFDPAPRPECQINGDQCDDDPTQDPSCLAVASSDRNERAAEDETDPKIRTDVKQ